MKRKLGIFFMAAMLIGCYSVRDASALAVTADSNLTNLANALGGGVTVTSVTGAAGQVGTYTNTSGTYGIGSPGIVLSSGKVIDYSDGPNTLNSTTTFPTIGKTTNFGGAGQADLTGIAGTATYDSATVEISFTALTNQISFDFVFGSEEYAEFVGSMFNDVFGAFLGGSGGTNVSFDASGNPITINGAWMSATPGTELDGTTGLLTTVVGGLTSGSTYSLLFGIADASDFILDSTVYISNFTNTTGLVAGTTPTNNVPEPSTMLLLGSGIVGLGVIRRKFKV